VTETVTVYVTVPAAEDTDVPTDTATEDAPLDTTTDVLPEETTILGSEGQDTGVENIGA
jgi:hypothetical protein